jgi:hypothetical protein
VVLVSMAAKSVTLVRPDLATFRFVANLAMTAAGLAILALLLGAGDLVVPTVVDPRLDTLARAVNMALRVSFFVALVVNVVTTALDVWRYARSRRVRFA